MVPLSHRQITRRTQPQRRDRIDFYLSAEGQRGLAASGKILLRRGVKSQSREVEQLMETGNFHVILPEGGDDRYMKIYNEFLVVR